MASKKSKRKTLSSLLWETIGEEWGGVHPNFAKIPGSDRNPVVVENENKLQHRAHLNLPTLLCR